MGTVTVTAAGEKATVTYAPPSTLLPGWKRTAANTGMAAVGTTTAMLTAYTGPLSVPANTKLYRKLIKLGGNQLTLNAGVILQECEIHGTRIGSQGMIRLVGGKQQIINCDEYMEGQGGEIAGVYGDAVSGVVIRSLKQTGGSIGLWLDSVNAEPGAVPSTVSEWMLTGQAGGKANPNAAHHDGFTRRAGNTTITIDSSWIFVGPPKDNPGGSSSTGAIFTQPTWGGLAGNVTVTNSYLGGYGWVVGLDKGNAGSYINNRIDPYEYGPASLICTPPWTWQNNYRYDVSKPDAKGAPIADPNK